MENICVLKLEKNKYYIAKTNNSIFSLDDCHELDYSEWTKKYKPIEIIELISNDDEINKVVLKYMNKYGIDNVRGGIFNEMKLDKLKIDIIKKILKSMNVKCSTCNEYGHNNVECISNDIELILNQSRCCEYCLKDFATNKDARYHEKFDCENNKNSLFDRYLNIVTNKKISKMFEPYSSINEDSIPKNNNTTAYLLICEKCEKYGHMDNDCYLNKNKNKKKSRCNIL